MYESKGMAIGAFLGAYLGIFCVVTIVIAVISIIANWKVYTKAGREGWKCLIPVYNVYVLYDMVWETKQFWIYFGLMIGSAVFTALGSNLFVTLVILALNIAILVWSIRLLHHLSVCFGHGHCFYCRTAFTEHSICHDPCFWRFQILPPDRKSLR